MRCFNSDFINKPRRHYTKTFIRSQTQFRFVAGARARLPELEVDFTNEKSRVDATQAILFRQLREHYQKRDRRRVVFVN